MGPKAGAKVILFFLRRSKVKKKSENKNFFALLKKERLNSVSLQREF
jgi:hypothetical protein